MCSTTGIPRKEIHASAIPASARSQAQAAPSTSEAYTAGNNPVTKNPEELSRSDWGKTLDGRGTGTKGGPGREILERQGHSPLVKRPEVSGTARRSREDKESQEGETGQGGKEARAAKPQGST
jgi:hypothetical protein